MSLKLSCRRTWKKPYNTGTYRIGPKPWIKCKFSYKVREEDRGRLDFQVALVKYNTEMRRIDYVEIPYDNMKLEIVLNTERNKVLPGSEETWSVTVKDYKGNPVAVPMFAVMYDAALDNFYPT